jgi:hypothetical protein
MTKVQSTYYPDQALTFNQWMQHIYNLLNKR